MDRTEFGNRQAEMTAQWFENVKQKYGDVDAYIAKRCDAYLDRWKEAGRFISDGSDVLDIGGGNLYEGLVQYLKDRGFRYSYRDVDYGSVDLAKDITARMGLEAPSVEHGFNDQLDFPDNSFDAVFSSHCIEHSIDLQKTFSELHRIIRPGGNLLMAVPFGWESNPEHPYFFGPSEWIALVQDAGFEIRIAQIGYEYPESGADYFIAARKIEQQGIFRINPDDYRKESYAFVPPDDQSISLTGEFSSVNQGIQSKSENASITIDVPEGASELLPIFHRHAWSGKIRMSSGETCDLSSWFDYDMPTEPIRLSPQEKCQVTINVDGRNPTAHWCEMIFLGYMWR